MMPLQYFLMLTSPTPSGANSGANLLGIALPASAHKPSPLPNEKPDRRRRPGFSQPGRSWLRQPLERPWQESNLDYRQ